MIKGRLKKNLLLVIISAGTVLALSAFKIFSLLRDYTGQNASKVSKWHTGSPIIQNYTNRKDCYISLADRASQQVMVLDPAVTDWNSQAAIKWSWKPDASTGFVNPPSGWGKPNGIRLRNSAVYGGQVALITDELGFCGIIGYPSGSQKYWISSLGEDAKLSAAELLGNGNIAVASCSNGWIRVYSSSSGINVKDYTETKFAGASGLIWDPVRKVLWAAGSSYLTGYSVSGTSERTELKEEKSYRKKLPAGASIGLEAYGTDALWVPSQKTIYRYAINSGSWQEVNLSKDYALGAAFSDVVTQPSGETTIALPYLKGQDSDTVLLLHYGQEKAIETRVRNGMNAAGLSIWNASYPALSDLAMPFPIAVTDQVNRRIVIYDPNISEWNKEGSILWQWKPNPGNGFDNISTWLYPSDVRLRKCEVLGGQVMAVCTSDGFMAVTNYPDGERVWSQQVTGQDSPHAIEVLPDGNVAVVASMGGWVRVYTSSQGMNSNHYAEFPLKDAHGVVWDPQNDTLWALGYEELIGLRVGGTPAEPAISEIAGKRFKIPVKGGHDLQPVHGNPDRLWITSKGVWQFVKSTGKFDADYDGSENINGLNVKSIGNTPDGNIVVRTSANGVYKDWCTNIVDLFHPVKGYGVEYESRIHLSEAYYKARIWNEDYQ